MSDSLRHRVRRLELADGPTGPVIAVYKRGADEAERERVRVWIEDRLAEGRVVFVMDENTDWWQPPGPPTLA